MDRTNRAELEKSRDKHQRRLNYRREQRDKHVKLSPGWWRWNKLAGEAKRMVQRREDQLDRLQPFKPKIVRLNAPMTNKFGALGPTRPGVGHYSAGPRPKTLAEALALFRVYNSQHRAQGWGAIGYMIGLGPGGELILLRPTTWKGAHTAGENSGRIGVVVLGGPGQRMNTDQREALAWLKAYGDTAAMPASHRLPAGALRNMVVHNDLNATACPGAYEADYKGVK